MMFMRSGLNVLVLIVITLHDFAGQSWGKVGCYHIDWTRDDDA